MYIFWLIIAGFFCCNAIATMTPIEPSTSTICCIESMRSFSLGRANNGLQDAFKKQQIEPIIDDCLKKLGADDGFFNNLLVSACKPEKCSLRKYILLSSAHVKTASFKYPLDIYAAKGRFIIKEQDDTDVIELIKKTLVMAKNKRISYNTSENILTVKIQIDFNEEFRGCINSQIIKIKHGNLAIILKKNLIDRSDKTLTSSFNGLSLDDIYIESGEVGSGKAKTVSTAPIGGSSMVFLNAADFLSATDFKYSNEDSDQSEYFSDNFISEWL